MTKLKDLTGQRFGRLTVVTRAKNTKNGQCRWLCKCDCGKEKIVRTTHLTSGKIKSCGCLLIDILKEKKSIHGMTNTKLFYIWGGIKARCYNKNNKQYKYYGARGIIVCDEWKNDFVSFYNWAMANGYKEHLSIDRIDFNGNYEPTNCRWTTNKEQQRNKSNNRFITYKNETKILTDWCNELNISIATMSARLKKLSIEKAFTTPIRGK